MAERKPIKVRLMEVEGSILCPLEEAAIPPAIALFDGLAVTVSTEPGLWVRVEEAAGWHETDPHGKLEIGRLMRGTLARIAAGEVEYRDIP